MALLTGCTALNYATLVYTKQLQGQVLSFLIQRYYIINHTETESLLYLLTSFEHFCHLEFSGYVTRGMPTALIIYCIVMVCQLIMTPSKLKVKDEVSMVKIAGINP